MMEANNMKAMREALEMFCGYSATVLNTGIFNRVHLEALLNKAKAALAAPPRQCDVGTAEEQNKRLCSDFFSVRQCGSFTRTALEWAQMPYNESEATDGK